MIKTKILVTGLNGFIGSRFKDLTKHKYKLTGFEHSKQKSITDRQYTFDFIKASSVDVVLHLAAKTHIDRCEKDKPFGIKSTTWHLNVNGTKNISDACREYKKYLLFLSTECVFDGKKSWYKETDKPNPINWYGLTKLKGEEALAKSGIKFCILRSTLAYGHPKPYPFDLFHFFINKFKRKEVVKAVNDQLLSLTYIDDLIKVISVLIDNRAQNIYHYAGSQSNSPYEFARFLGKKFKVLRLIKPVSLIGFFGKGSKLRLKNATLSSDKIKKDFNISASELNESLNKLFTGI